jgi:hypothetical protein
MTDPRAAAATLTPAVRRWLRAIEAQLDLGDRHLDAIIDPARLRVARAAYGLLVS